MNENENTDNIGYFGEYNPLSVESVSEHPTLKVLYKRIADLESELVTHKTIASEAQQRLLNERSEYRENEGKLQDILIEALGDEEVDKDVADKIAELYGLDLRKVFSINIQVVVNVEVSAPVGTDPQDIVDNVGFGYGGITYSGVGDLESDSWEIDDWEEV
jgi:hypothetical protein